MRSVMSHQFSQVPSANIPRSSFDRSHGYKTTFDAGYLVPFYVDEALPGDTFSLRASIFARMNTPIVPIMDNLKMDTFFFAVPIRLIWTNWEKLNGAQTDPDNTFSGTYLVPQMLAPASTGYATGSLSDYMGIPIGIALLNHSALWHRAYNLIWNEWFRDENLQDSVTVDLDDGPDDNTDYVLLRRGKRHDYFTSCLPWPQKAIAVDMPLGTQAPIRGSKHDGTITDLTYLEFNNGASYFGTTATTKASQAMETSSNAASATRPLRWQQSDNTSIGTGDDKGYNFADLSDATAATINQLREAFQIQKVYERDARGGSRYTEIIRSHFGVVSPDARLQRPEYLGGGSTNVTIAPIAQTSSTDATTPQGNLAAMGIATASGHGFVKSFTEHCVLIGLVNVRADLNYQQGLNRMFSRRSRFDFYWPSLAHIGEQAVLNKEIMAQETSADEEVFGYQERYAEYRYKPSQITGLFRSNASGTIHIWHLAQDFATLPLLDSDFIVDDPPVDRVIATPTKPHFMFDSYINLKCARPMPVYSVPGLIDHF